MKTGILIIDFRFMTKIENNFAFYKHDTYCKYYVRQLKHENIVDYNCPVEKWPD